MKLTKGLLIFGLAAATASFATKYEAEEATLEGDAAAKGTYVDMNEGNIVFPNVSVETTGKYTITVHCAGAYGYKENFVKVNDNTAGKIVNEEGNDFIDASVTATLNAGKNTITIAKSWGWIKVDYIEVSTFVPTPFAIGKTPVTPNATAEAVKLYNFLVNNFGKKTISGVMTGDMDKFTVGNDFKTHPDVHAVYTASGKYPALVGVDFLFATGPKATDSWYMGYTDKAVALATNLWNQGGIPAFTWHWKDPADSVDAFYANQSSAGSGKDYTTFDFTRAFSSGTTWDTTSAAFKGIVRDIDYIADIFLKLQDAKVAAIFRPLHEAGGKWFWWSTHEGEQFAALYRLVYERMVFKKGVRNLIWVFNPENSTPTTWNPGITYYDVLSIDIYNPANDYSSNAGAFDGFKEKWGVSKVLALSENGPIPDVNNMVLDQAIWSWWMPWYESWSGGYVSQTESSVWQSNMADERIITFDEMPGWDKYNEENQGTAETKLATETSTYTAAIRPFAKVSASKLSIMGKNVMLTTATTGNVSVDVFAMNGRRIATLFQGNLFAGTYAFSLADMPKGNYIVRVKEAGLTTTQPVIVK